MELLFTQSRNFFSLKSRTPIHHTLRLLFTKILNSCSTKSWTPIHPKQELLFTQIWNSYSQSRNFYSPKSGIPVHHRGASSAAYASEPDKTPIIAVRGRCRLFFFKIKVRPGSCWSYPVWHFCTILSDSYTPKFGTPIHQNLELLFTISWTAIQENL